MLCVTYPQSCVWQDNNAIAIMVDESVGVGGIPVFSYNFGVLIEPIK